MQPLASDLRNVGFEGTDFEEDGADSEFAPTALIDDSDEEHLFANEGEATEEFPEYFDEPDLEHKTPPLAHQYNLGNQENREAAAVLLDFNYEYRALLTPQEAMSIDLYRSKIEKNICREAHQRYSESFAVVSGSPTLDIHTVSSTMERITGIAHVRYDVCINNCVCFAKYEDKLSCPFCGEARHRHVGRKDVPRKTFDYLPAQHRLLLQYSDPKRARALKSYRRMFVARGGGDTTDLRDFWDGKLCAELQKKGVLTDPRSVAFYFSMDGVNLFWKGRQHTVHPLLLINYNLHPELRFQEENIICLGIIPGQRSPRTCSLSCTLWLTNSNCSLRVSLQWMPPNPRTCSVPSSSMLTSALSVQTCLHAMSSWGFLGTMRGNTVITAASVASTANRLVTCTVLYRRRRIRPPAIWTGAHTTHWTFLSGTTQIPSGGQIMLNELAMQLPPE